MESARRNLIRAELDKRLRAEKDPAFLARKREEARRYYYRPESQQKVLARRTLKAAVAAGRVSRCPCERCGEQNTQAHHHDYSKPLDVRWLCRRCHADEHSSEERSRWASRSRTEP